MMHTIGIFGKINFCLMQAMLYLKLKLKVLSKNVDHYIFLMCGHFSVCDSKMDSQV